MIDYSSDSYPRSQSEAAGIQGASAALADWDDDNWIQFSTWHTHQIRAYLHRVLTAGGES